MASHSEDSQENGKPPQINVLFLASEWGSSKGGLSTISREIAINIAKFPEINVTFFVPQCNDEEKSVARRHNIHILQAKRVPGMDELYWLCFPPHDLPIDVVVGHGIKLGPQAEAIRRSRGCKWIQVVHTAPEEYAPHKTYPNPISSGEEKHRTEVELCQLAHAVVTIGPRLYKAFCSYLRSCENYAEKVFSFTPGIFSEFCEVKQDPNMEPETLRVLLFGRGDTEDFLLKGFDIAAKAIAVISHTHLIFVGAPNGKEEEVRTLFLSHGIHEKKLTVRGYSSSREQLREMLHEFDLALMPSRTEGFGLAGLEALSAGLPVLVSLNSGFGEALMKVPFGSSSVIDSHDSQIWAEKIQHVCDKNRGLRLEEAKTLRESYGKRYSWEEPTEKLVSKIVNMVHDVFSLCRSSAQQETQQISTTTENNSGEEMNAMREQLDDLSRQLQEKDSDIVALQNQATEVQGRDEQVTGLDSQSNTEMNEAQTMREHLTRLHQQLKEQSSDIKTLNKQVAELEKKLSEKQQENTTMRNQLTDLHGQIKEKDTNSTNLREQVNNLQEKVNMNMERVVTVTEDFYEKWTTLQEKLAAEQQRNTDLQRRLGGEELEKRTMTERLESLRGQLQQKDESEENLQQQLRIEQNLVINLRNQLQTNERQLAAAREELLRGEEQRVTELQRQQRTNEGEITRVREQLERARQVEGELNRTPPDWFIDQKQIQITTEVLGHGAWGTVLKGNFRGADVAVKKIHESIISSHNRRLFEREVKISSKCRHPCLLQFIGANTDAETPFLVTEIMDCSLRDRLDKGSTPLSREEVSIISLDVATALNYLHQKPTPIIHHDISSANVLLWGRHEDQWRAKLADFGTANFAGQSNRADTGARIYVAPELLSNSPNQPISCKVDVYSFGVLLCEMCITRLPDSEQRKKQIEEIRDIKFKDIVTSCVERNPMMRPNMEEVIESLKKKTCIRRFLRVCLQENLSSIEDRPHQPHPPGPSCSKSG